MNLWVTIYRLAWALLGLLFLVVLIYVFSPPIRQFDDLRRREARLDDDIRFQEELLKHLKTKQDRLMNDPRFVERIARENLGLARPGETIYKVNASPATNTSVPRGPR